MVRFASAPHRWMRKSHSDIIPWLDKKGIEYVRGKHSSMVYYSLPEELAKYEVISKEIAKEVAPLALHLKRALSSLQYTRMSRVRQPLSEEEYRNLAEEGIPLIL